MPENGLNEDEQSLIDAILDFDEDAVLAQVKQLVDAGEDPLQIAEVARFAMDKVGHMFENKEIFLTELIMAGELLKGVMTELGFTPEKKSQAGGDKGTVLIGTVAGDIHDIGKNIVTGLLAANGFRIIDLGVEVPPEKFVEEVQAQSPNVVAMCGLLTIAYEAMKVTVDALNAAGLRDQVKIIIGGGAVDQKVCDFVGADAWGGTAADAVKLCQQFIS